MDIDYGHDNVIATDPDRPGVRWIVMDDPDAEDPRENWDVAQLLTYRMPYYGNRPEIDAGEDQADTGTLRAFIRAYNTYGDEDKAALIARRYANVYEPGSDIYVGGWQGSTQSDWGDYVIVTTEGDAAGYAKEFNMWAEGNVFCVVAEHFIDGQWTRENDQGIESLWLGGIYADSWEEAVDEYETSA